MTTKLLKCVGRYDFSTEHNDVSTDLDESTIKMLENEQGKNGPLRSSGICDGLVRTGRNELRLNIALTASCIVIHKMPPKKRTCKRQQQRVTEIMESAVSGEESTSSIKNQEPGGTNRHSTDQIVLK
ncbi:hypothetical protein DPMN_180843 [Dreissena polymorpha]|uniref:Uncharacterized protein n=1 Tax=Dreissena polymorpha TaxID=45954 RepID=A0A9D4DDA7_DREPO|nr:hypothetical protein DPMN_180843 [Dreissena polymorpha]